MERIWPTTSNELVEDVQVLFLLLLGIGGVTSFKLVVLVLVLLVVLLAVPVHLLEELASQASTSLLIATCSLGYRSVDIGMLSEFSLHLFARHGSLVRMLQLLGLGQLVCVEGRVREGLLKGWDGAAIWELVAGLTHDLLIEGPG